MDETLSAMVTHIKDAGGSTSWDDLMTVVPYEQRRNIPNLMRQGEAANLFKRTVKFTPGVGVSFTVELGEGGA